MVTTEIVWLASRCWGGGRGVSWEILMERGRRGRGRGGGGTYFECFANTEDNPQSTIERGFRLARDKLHTPEHQISALVPIAIPLPPCPHCPPRLSPLSTKNRKFPTSSPSFSTVLLSLCPTNVHPTPLSFNCSALISPVNAPFPLSNTFCAATSISVLGVRGREGGRGRRGDDDFWEVVSGVLGVVGGGRGRRGMGEG